MGNAESHENDAEMKQKRELEKEKDNPDNKKLDGAEFKGPSDPSNRKTTDCCCIILICAMWFSLTVLGLMVTGVIPSEDLPAGNPAKLTHMVDYDTNICSVDTIVEDKEYAYFLPTGQVICIEKCPEDTDYTKFICKYDVQDTIDDYAKAAELIGGEALATTTRQLWGLYYATMYSCIFEVASVVGPGYTCIPNLDDPDNAMLAQAAEAGADQLLDDSYKPADPPEESSFDQFSEDLMHAFPLILIFGFVVAAMVGFAVLRVLRIPCVLPFIIWGCIIGVFSFLFGIGSMLKFYTAETWKQEDPEIHTQLQIKMVEYMGYFFLGCSALWFCIICCLRSRIALAIGITKEACRAMGNLTLLIFFPVIQTAGLIAFSCVWFVYMVYLASSGDIERTTYSYPTGCDEDPVAVAAGTCYSVESTQYIYSENTQKAYWYFLFCWFWTSEFIMAIGQLVVALSVCLWYFTRDKTFAKSQLVVQSIYTAFRYHLGSAAFGSLIIAIIKTIRAFIAYLQGKVDQLAAKGGKAAVALAKIILCCLQCCMWCVEKCAKFLNKMAYIQIALFSYSFCKAARCAFFLILRNILLIAAVAIVSEFTCALVLILIPMMTTFLAYNFFATMTELNSIFGVTFFTMCISYFTALKFTETLGMIISTILQCYIADTELFPPDQRYAEGSLKSAVSSGTDRHKVKPADQAPEKTAVEPYDR